MITWGNGPTLRIVKQMKANTAVTLTPLTTVGVGTQVTHTFKQLVKRQAIGKKGDINYVRQNCRFQQSKLLESATRQLEKGVIGICMLIYCR